MEGFVWGKLFTLHNQWHKKIENSLTSQWSSAVGLFSLPGTCLSYCPPSSHSTYSSCRHPSHMAWQSQAHRGVSGCAASSWLCCLSQQCPWWVCCNFLVITAAFQMLGCSAPVKGNGISLIYPSSKQYPALSLCWEFQGASVRDIKIQSKEF